MQNLPTFVYVIAAIVLIGLIAFVLLVLFVRFINRKWDEEDEELRPYGGFDYERSADEARRNNKYI